MPHASKCRKIILSLAAVAVSGVCARAANAAAFLWISAPNWSYSAAAADSPAGSAFFWGLSVGPGTYSFAYAFSNDGLGDGAFAFAEASSNSLGGVGAVNVAGLADPYAGVGIDIPLTDPTLPGSFPATKPGTDPLSSAYTVSGTKITFSSGSGEELNGVDELQAFLYTGGTDDASLQAALGTSADNGTSSAGDVTDMNALMSDFGLVPLDAAITDPGSLSELDFTENDLTVNPADVILVGEGEATPEPASLSLLALGGLTLLRRRRK